MSRNSRTSGEEVYLMVEHVKLWIASREGPKDSKEAHKGSLFVTSENLQFQVQGKDTFDHRYHYSEIKCKWKFTGSMRAGICVLSFSDFNFGVFLSAVQKQSAETKTKVQLQIILQTDASYTFQFTNPKGQADQLKDRNAVKDMLAGLLPKFKRKINKAMEEKTR